MSAAAVLLQAAAVALVTLLAWLWLRARSTASSLPEPPPAAKDGDEPQLSARELARILGNSAPQEDAGENLEETEEEAPPPVRQPLSENELRELVQEVVARRAPISEVPEVDLGPSGEELLQGLEEDGHNLAVHLVKKADSTAINFVDDCGRNALMFCASEGHWQACRVLLSREDFEGINLRNNTGATALHMAAANDYPDICRALLECPRFTQGVNAETDQGATPLDFAMNFGDDHSAATVIRNAGGLPGGRFGTRQEMRGGRRLDVRYGDPEPDAENTERPVVEVDALD
eukprot:gnl/TRDRNA2_/TRDRNA2_198047_c0_seq1.p1 gnl/TRDRNA2_/TRDRNA2_198047_c0~~gnl/TRDRNA2_/TRDRNA2_198047_c0_seq1.p1  ORF type:complete len:290 (+),score=60.64 gnl/TRDRNA2_/TRDRNA2_198047_c0_seq1:21-890(+)